MNHMLVSLWLFFHCTKCMDDAKRKVGWSPGIVQLRQTVSQPEEEHEDEDRLTLRLLFKATLKRISDLG